MKKITGFFKEVASELKKVSWSSRDEIIGSTSVVIITVALLAVFIGAIDLLLGWLATHLIK